MCSHTPNATTISTLTVSTGSAKACSNSGRKTTTRKPSTTPPEPIGNRKRRGRYVNQIIINLLQNGCDFFINCGLKFTCPVCRDVIDVDLSELKQAPQPYEVQNFKTEFRKDAKFVSLRQRMEAVYLKQKTNGGIIDQTAEDSRFLVVTEASSPTVEQPPAAPVQEPAVVIEASAIKLPEASKRGRGRWTRKPNAQKERPPVTANSVTGPPPKTASTRGSRNPSANIRETKTPRESHLPRHQVSRPPPGFEPRLAVCLLLLSIIA